MAVWATPLTKLAASFRTASGFCRVKESRAKGATILVYHGVVDRISDRYFDRYSIDVRTLRAHLGFLKRRRKVISLSTLLQALAQNHPVDDRWAVLTFDDALKSQLTVAADLLAAHQLPWALSIPAGLVGTNSTVWTYAFRLLVVRLWKDSRIRHPLVHGEYVACGSEGQRHVAADAISKILMHDVSDAQRAAYLIEAIAAVGADRLEEEIVRDRRFVMASWSSIRAAVQGGVEPCSHGYDHLPHNAQISSAGVRRELFDSRALLAEKLTVAPEAFVLPNGLATPRTFASMALAGYGACLTSNAGRVLSGADMMALPRFDGEYCLNVLRYHLINSH